jgi:hypothetical protein
MKRLNYYLVLAFAVILLIGLSIAVAGANCIEAPQIADLPGFDEPQDNTYFPMSAIGKTYVYWAETADELILNAITTTDVIYNILGVDCTVVYDVEWVYIEDKDDWFMTEETYDWYAWDNDGNVWYFGEWTTEFEYDEDWNPIGENHDGSWEAGVDEALPGIVMPADPVPGLCYQQEYYEGEAEDMGKVLRLDVNVSIDYDDYEGCLKTKEWTPLDPGTIEHKYYAPDVGLVYIEELKEKTVKVELIDIVDADDFIPPG